MAALGDKNGIVVRLNTLSAEVMKEQGIEIIDAYGLLASRLELASGDHYHWQGPAYELLGREIIDRISPVLTGAK